MDYEEFKEEVVKRLSKFAGETNVQLMGNRLNLMLGGRIAISFKLNEAYKDFESGSVGLDCQHFFRQIFLGYFPDIVQAFDTLGRNVYGDDYTSLHNPIVLSSVLLVYGMFHSTQILF